MVNKHHEYILRAFLAVRIPDAVKHNAPSVMVTDSVLEDCCMRLMNNEHRFRVPDVSRIVGDDRDRIMGLIGSVADWEREELMDYYRLLMLTVSVLGRYT